MAIDIANCASALLWIFAAPFTEESAEAKMPVTIKSRENSKVYKLDNTSAIMANTYKIVKPAFGDTAGSSFFDFA